MYLYFTSIVGRGSSHTTATTLPINHTFLIAGIVLSCVHLCACHSKHRKVDDCNSHLPLSSNHSRNVTVNAAAAEVTSARQQRQQHHQYNTNIPAIGQCIHCGDAYGPACSTCDNPGHSKQPHLEGAILDFCMLVREAFAQLYREGSSGHGRRDICAIRPVLSPSRAFRAFFSA